MRILHWRQLFIGIIVEFGSISIYRLIQSATPGIFDLSTPLDRWIPFWPSWIWIYISVLPFFLYAALTLRPPLFATALKRVITAHLCTYPFFFLIPSDYPRPTNLNPETFYGWGYGVMHSIDQANNTFSSLHVSLTFVIMHHLHRNGTSAKLTYGYTLIISLSTMLTKQHYVIDVIGRFMIFLVTLRIIKDRSL